MSLETTVTQWQKPSADQGSSRLVSLPAELRLVILRELLTTDICIGQRQKYDAPCQIVKGTRKSGRLTRNRFATPKNTVKQVDGFHLYPEVLRSCQTLFTDGEPILYHENRIELSVKTTIPNRCFCGHCFSVAQTAQFTCRLRPFISVVPGGGAPDTSVVRDTEKQFAKKFNKFHLVCFSKCDNSTLIPAQPIGVYLLLNSGGLAAMLSEGDVTVSAHPEMSPRVNEQAFKNFVESFRGLRCPSFEFVDVPYRPGSQVFQACEDVEKTVKSSTQTIDLRPAVARLRNMQHTLYGLHRHDLTNYRIGRFFKDAEAATYVYDTEKFNSARDSLIKMLNDGFEALKDSLEEDNTLVAAALAQRTQG